MAWSLVLAAIGVAGMWVAGKSRYGWWVGFAAQPLWAAYAITTGQYGFLITAFAYGAVYLRNALLPTERPQP